MYWCSYSCYRYMLLGDLERLTKKKGWTETRYRKSHLFKSIWYIILHLNGQLTMQITRVIKTHGAELKVLILFCSLRSWLCSDVDAHQPQPLQNWGLIHELPFWLETNHEDTVIYFKKCTFAGGLPCTIIFVSICQLTYCLPAVFQDSLLQFLLCYIWNETAWAT